MIPYRDENPTEHPAIVTFAIIVLTGAAWFFLQGAGFGSELVESVCRFGVIPGELLGRVPPGTSVPLSREMSCVLGDNPRWISLVTSMFMHAGWLHIIGNMWFLWIFGNNVEDVMGHGRFIVFYLVTGLAATAAQTIANPASPVPMVGASGAISGIMGAYIIMFPRVRVHTLVPIFIVITTVALPAWLMLGYWFLIQLAGGFVGQPSEGGVAFWAHAGGFIAGAVLIKFFVVPDRLKPKKHAKLVEMRWDGRRGWH